jgi:hypothetical protein
VKVIWMLLHASVLIFFVGLVDFMLPINKTITRILLGYLTLAFLCAATTLNPRFIEFPLLCTIQQSDVDLSDADSCHVFPASFPRSQPTCQCHLHIIAGRRWNDHEPWDHQVYHLRTMDGYLKHHFQSSQAASQDKRCCGLDTHGPRRPTRLPA